MNSLDIDKSWIEGGLNIDLIKRVLSAIEEKRKTRKILPSQNDVLNALKLTSLKDVKVLIIGQDPYPDEEHAHGLAFSSLSAKTPASLKNIFKKLEKDFPESKHCSNLLDCWARQGVLLLNTSLTFEDKSPKVLKEHTELWKPIIENIFTVLKNRKRMLIVMRWGAHAQKAGKIFEGAENVVILDTTHPSPLSANRGFMDSDHFFRCNKILKNNAIDWST